MTPWWDEKAGRLQSQSFGDHPTESGTKDDTYKIILHARQDIILIVSYLSSLNRQASHISLLLVVVVMLLTYIAFKH
jgi:hypothetical protein